MLTDLKIVVEWLITAQWVEENFTWFNFFVCLTFYPWAPVFQHGVLLVYADVH